MSTWTINGTRVVSGSITIPNQGAWSGDVGLADATELPTDPFGLAVKLGDAELTGTSFRTGPFSGSRSARVVAGAGAWRKVLPPKAYAHVAGVRMSAVLSDVARESGEKIEIGADRVIGTHYIRERAKAERVLNLLLSGAWWVDTKGVTQIGARDARPITSPFTVVSWSGAKGQFEIATEAYGDWMPGRTFSSPTVSKVQTISSVTFEATEDGSIKLHVLSTDGADERLRTDLRAIIRAEMASLTYAGVWEYEIAASPLSPGLLKTIDCTPTDARMPAITGVPLFGIGVVSPPVTGTKCRIRFVNCDPTRPECFALESTTEHAITAEAVALLIYNTLCELAIAQPAAFTGVVVQPLVAAAVTAAIALVATPPPPGLVAQAAAALAQAGNFASGTPSTAATPFAAAIATALDAKVLDVSGQFPNIGVPNG